MGTIRGFSFAHVGPHDQNDDDVAIGGRFRALSGIEYSMPLWTFGENVQLRGIAFADSGSVGSFNELGRWRLSLGGGLRLVDKRLGGEFIGIDAAGALIREDEDREQPISFFIGIRF